MADDPDAPKGYKRPSASVPAASTPGAAPVIAADPDAPATYKRPDSGTPAPAPPDPNAYKSPDWLPGAGFLHKASQIYDNAFTGSAADYLTGKAGELARSFGISNTTPSVAQLRAETKQDRADVGPVVSALADTAGYMTGVGKVLGPAAGKLAPVAGRYGAAAVEGAAANAIDVAGSHLGSDQPLNLWDAGKHIVAGGVAGVAGQGVGDLTAPVIRRVGNFVQGLPGRGGEQWDWRTAADPQAKIDDYRVAAPPASVAPGSPQDKALADTSKALAQSTDPGMVAHLATGAGTTAAAKFGLTPYLDSISGLAEAGGFGAGGVSALVGNPIARGINTVDKNINVGQSFDKLYPALTGQPSTVDTSNWANLLRQGWIGQQAQP